MSKSFLKFYGFPSFACQTDFAFLKQDALIECLKRKRVLGRYRMTEQTREIYEQT